jgi:hypothetical protein
MGCKIRNNHPYIPSNTRTADQVKIVMTSEVIANASEAFEMRRCFACHYSRILFLLEFDDLLQEKLQNEQTSRPRVLIGSYERIRRKYVESDQRILTQYQGHLLTPWCTLKTRLAHTRTCCFTIMIRLCFHS